MYTREHIIKIDVLELQQKL